MTSRTPVVMAAVVAVAQGSAALADPPPLTVTWDVTGDASGAIAYSWDWYGNAPTFGKHGLPGSDQMWTGWMYSAAASDAGNAWDFSWNVVFNETLAGGAFVTTNIVITNNSLSTETFSSEVVMPLTQTITSPQMNGGIEGTITDLTLDTATVSAPAGWQIYTPRIDGIDEVDGFLMVDPFSEFAGFLATSQVGPEAFGDSTPLAASQDAVQSIGLLLNFDLSPGDSASFTAHFQLTALPGPGGVAAFVIAGLALRRRRR